MHISYTYKYIVFSTYKKYHSWARVIVTLGVSNNSCFFLSWNGMKNENERRKNAIVQQ